MSKGKTGLEKKQKLILSDGDTVEIQYKNNYVKSNLEIGDQIKNIKKILIDKNVRQNILNQIFR